MVVEILLWCMTVFFNYLFLICFFCLHKMALVHERHYIKLLLFKYSPHHFHIYRENVFPTFSQKSGNLFYWIWPKLWHFIILSLYFFCANVWAGLISSPLNPSLNPPLKYIMMTLEHSLGMTTESLKKIHPCNNLYRKYVSCKIKIKIRQ